MADRPVIISEADAPTDEWDDPVRGRVTFTTLVSGDVTPTSGLTTGVAHLEPGGWLGRHRHAPEEVYFVLAGSAVVSLDGEERRVAAGDAVFIPGGLEHGVRNDSPTDVRLVYSIATDCFEDVEYEWTAEGGDQDRR